MGVLSGFEHIVRDQEPLAPYTWFRLGGAAEYFAEPTTVEELQALVKACQAESIPVRLLGGGSNLIVRDEGVRGMVVHLTAAAFCGIRTEGNVVEAGGGAKLAHVISSCVREGLAGLEQLVGIPGTLGGALHGNAGTESGDVGQWAESATVMLRDGRILVRQRPDLRFAYRQSSLDELVILSARLVLERESPEALTKRMQKLWIVKKASQPGGEQLAGCIFKNPSGASAASLIELAGLKGSRVGQVEVSGQNPNFFLASPGAKSLEVLELMEQVRGGVRQRLGVVLEPQIEIW